MPIRLQGTPIVPVCVVLVFMAVFALPHEVTADEPGWRLIGTEGPPPRHSPGMVYDSARNVVVMFGGITGREREGILYGDTWEWDGVEWKKAADTGPSPRLGHSMVYDSRRQVVVLFGGNDGNFQNDTWEWDGTEWKLAATDGPRPRGRHSMAYDQERGVVVLFLEASPGTWAIHGNGTALSGGKRLVLGRRAVLGVPWFTMKRHTE